MIDRPTLTAPLPADSSTLSGRIVVTGGTGFVGQAVLQQLLKRDVEIHCLVRSNASVAKLPQSLLNPEQSRINWHVGELTDTQFLREHLLSGDVVVHLAAALAGNRERQQRETLSPTETLVNAAIEKGVGRLVLVSSLGVYGLQHVPRGGIVDESSPLDASPQHRDPYTAAKIQQEQLVWEAHLASQLPVVVVRPGVIYGTGRPLISSRMGLRVGPLLLNLSNQRRLPYVHVDNCAAGIVQAACVSGIDGEAFNLIDDDFPTSQELLAQLRRAGAGIRSVSLPDRIVPWLAAASETCSFLTAGRIPPVLTRYKADALWKPVSYSNTKARHKLNWLSQISTEAGLQSTISSICGNFETN